MRFHPATAAFYCGTDRHARTMDLCVLDRAGQVQLRRNLPANPDAFLPAVAPYRLDGVIRRLERQIAAAAEGHYAQELAVLRSIPGVGRRGK
jgi:hypothetical protein